MPCFPFAADTRGAETLCIRLTAALDGFPF